MYRLSAFAPAISSSWSIRSMWPAASKLIRSSRLMLYVNVEFEYAWVFQ